MTRRALDFRDFGAVAAEVERLRRTGYDQAGNWNLAQVCDHLAAAMRGSVEGFPFPGPWFFRTLIGPFARRVFFRRRRMPAGIQIPERFRPAADVDEAAAVRAFHAALALVRDWPGEFVPHPILGRFTPAQWRQFHLIHAAHHLSFLVPRDTTT
ncbi:MAG TPA: DUF1569 domain-containing protein [Gemmataceae bacterium]|nr:DUF1569 domain-containing protein [Gemmataceae bacterium]